MKVINMINKRDKRLGEQRVSNQGCLMKIVEYNNNHNIVVEFQDEHKSKVKTDYNSFNIGQVRNPCLQPILGVGRCENIYPIRGQDGKLLKEYTTWNNMLKRCFLEEEKCRHKTYRNVCCCNEWLVYDNFFEWAKTQSNYDLWKSGGNKWHLDKDIISKESIYSPRTCCLVPDVVNKLFNKQNRHRGDLPIGVTKNGNGFMAKCRNPLTKGRAKYLGTYLTPEEAFYTYKEYKENIIKQVAKLEFDNNNITKRCYNAMMHYEIEITD